MAFILVRPIDLAIFGTLGLLWIGGALFIVVLYRWIANFEREQGGEGPQLDLADTGSPAKPKREADAVLSQSAAREALVRG